MKLEDLRSKLDATLSHLRTKLAGIRTGIATASLVEDLLVTAYEGADPLTLKELAGISVPEPNLILIQPWDASIVAVIGKALRESVYGFNPIISEAVIRVPIPPLSEERRRELAKMVRDYGEEAKVAARSIRQNVMKALNEMEKAGEFSEDERFQQRAEVEKVVKEAIVSIEDAVQVKEEDLLSI